MTKRVVIPKILKLIAVGNSTGAILPKAVLDRLRVGQGDPPYVSEGPDGVEMRVSDPDFENLMATAREVATRTSSTIRSTSSQAC